MFADLIFYKLPGTLLRILLGTSEAAKNRCGILDCSFRLIPSMPRGIWLSMKKLAAAFEGKSAEMMKPPEAERITGYKTGGISPFGQTRKTSAAIEEHALAHDLVYINGGQRGLQVRLQVRDLVSALNAIVAPTVA